MGSRARLGLTDGPVLLTDLFEKMVPVAVQQSVACSNQRKADLVNRLIAQMRESTNLANG